MEKKNGKEKRQAIVLREVRFMLPSGTFLV
jgi:hypothetical protein